ncbi:MAG: hypothetical protein JEZ00_13460 [Anaerolineaceae bacterium]|nr:hypothetical protein [Anaerolineaceae bacterium]
MRHPINKHLLRGFLLVMILITISCSCMPGKNEFNGEEATAETAAVVEMTTSTVAPTKTKAALPTDTVEPTLDEAAAATELATILEEYAQVSLREWSVPTYPDSTFLLDDRDGMADWDEIVASQARNLAIESPYYYEFYEMPPTTKYADVRAYFNDEIPPLGYKTGADMQGTNQIYLLTFVNDGGSIKRKIVVQYWGVENMIMIIYKTPE